MLGLTVALVELTRAEGFDRALDEVSRTRPQALFLINTAVTVTYRARIVDFALKNRVSLVRTQGGWAEAGALMNYASSITDASRRAAAYVDISKHAGRVNGESIVVEQLAARSSAHLTGVLPSGRR